MIAATITTVLVKQGLGSARNASVFMAQSNAKAQVETYVSKIQVLLSSDPLSFTNKVLDGEDTRVCLVGSSANSEFSSGQSWPVECGLSWGYAQTTGQSVENVKLHYRIYPPSTSSPSLKILVVGEQGMGKFGQEITFDLTGAGVLTVASLNNLDLSSLNSGSQLSGLIYARNVLTATAAEVFSQRATLAAEQGLISLPVSNITAYSASTSTTPPSNTATPPIKQIRDLLPATPTTSNVAGWLNSLNSLSCNGSPNKIFLDPTTGKILSNSLCITPGAVLYKMPATGEPVSQATTITVPVNTKALLVLPKVRDGNQVLQLYAAGVTSWPTTDNCAVSDCNLRFSAATSDSLAAGTHPGGFNHWSSGFLGEIPVPSSGIVHTGVNTYLGLCGSLFVNGPNCDESLESALVADLTFVVGTTNKPKDLIIGSSLQTPNSTLSVLVSGESVLPYWATPQAVQLNLDAQIWSLGLGHLSALGGAPAFRNEPSALSVQARSRASNLSGSLKLRGSIFAPALQLTFPIMLNTKISPFPQVTSLSQGPWFPGIQDSWTVTAIKKATMSQMSLA